MCKDHDALTMSRRGALVGGLATMAAALPFGRAFAQEAITPDQALARLMEGNERYVCCETLPRKFSKDRAALALSQRPFAAILGCADSRVAPELAFDQSRGQLFVLRVAGNTLNTDNLASMEYAVAELGTPLIMVLGHSACGAVGAAIKVVEDDAQLPGHLPALIDPIKPAVEAVRGRAGDLLTNAIKQNVRQTVAEVMAAGPIVAPAVADGRVKVVGGFYELETGKVRLIG
jgi:carbonic anhydrase